MNGMRRYRARLRPRRVLSCIALAASVLLLTPIERDSDAGTSGWVVVDREQGISVSQRDEPNRQFPTFKGLGNVKASIYDVLAVILDHDSHTQWVHDCNGAEKLATLGDHEIIVYNRTDAPWPIKDRDVVLKGTLKIVTPGKQIIAKFRVTDDSLKPRVPDVIRMPHLSGHWKLTQLKNGTQVEYKVNADPAGKLWAWLVKRTARDIPMYTIVGLRRQVAKTKGTYDAEIETYKARGY